MNFEQRRKHLKDIVEAFEVHIKLYPQADSLKEGLVRVQKELAEHNASIGRNHKR